VTETIPNPIRKLLVLKVETISEFVNAHLANAVKESLEESRTK
jgi:hypothetical protein